MPRPEVAATAATLHQAFGSGTFTSAQAATIGVTPHRLWSATRSGLVVRLEQGRYRVAGGQGADARVPQGLTAQAAARVHDRILRLALEGTVAALAPVSAVSAWELPTYEVDAPEHPVLWVPRHCTLTTGVRGGVRLARRDIDARRIVIGPGQVPMTDPLLTAVHLAALPGLSLAARLVVLHGGLRRQWEWIEAGAGRFDHRDMARYMADARIQQILREELADVLAHADLSGRGRAGVSVALPRSVRLRLQEAVGILDARVETPLESISWALFHQGGIALPTPQARVRGASGVLWRVDFLFEGHVIGECDGAVKYHGGYTAWQEKRRQSDLEAEGYAFVRWTWEELHSDPDRILARIDLALNRRL